MAKKIDDELPWPPPATPPRPPRDPRTRPDPEDLLSPATQIVRDRDVYLGQDTHDVGRRLTDDQIELFASGDAVDTLAAQFDRVSPVFIALHDVGTSASLRLLTAVAGASGGRVQRLAIRKQGLGIALAVLQFVEIPIAGDSPLRVYSTDTDADAATRARLSLLLLSRARLGVVMVGELPSHALATQFKPLREALEGGAWPNRELLLLPLGSATTLASQAPQLAGRSGVVVRVTPQAARPNEAWSFISGTWNRLNAGGALATEMTRAVPRAAVPRAEAPTQPMALPAATLAAPPAAPSVAPQAARPHPAAPARPVAPPPPVSAPVPLPAVATGQGRWADYAARCAGVKGVVSACVFDATTRRPLAHAGGEPAPEALAEQGAALLEAMGLATHALGLGSGTPEAAVTLGQQHLVLRPVPGHPGIVLHLMLNASANNLTLARMQLDRVPLPGA